MANPEPPSPLLRMLRQGRGNGFREALHAGPSTAEDVLSCVLDDPRWDRQVEQRDPYYAALLVRFDVDIAPIADRVLREDNDEDESAFWLPIGVLAEMSRRGDEPAMAALAEAIRRASRWRACLDALEAAGGEVLIRAVVQSRDVQCLAQSVDAEALVDAMRMVAAPWEEWASEVVALRFLSDAKTRPGTESKPMSGPVGWAAARIRRPANPAVSPSLTTDELLGLAITPGASMQIEEILRTRSDEPTAQSLCRAATGGTAEQRLVALGVLGGRGCVQFLEEAERSLRDESQQSRAERTKHRTRHAYLRYLERLPPDFTLERARQWFKEPWPLSLAGEHILAQHATRDDRPMLEEAGSVALASNEMYRLCSIVDALATIGAWESVPLLHEVYSVAPYSYARRRVVNALLPHVRDDHVARDLVEEALWDCEAEARELACGAVSFQSITTARRLAELTEDQFEETAVRAAAQRAHVSQE